MSDPQLTFTIRILNVMGIYHEAITIIDCNGRLMHSYAVTCLTVGNHVFCFIVSRKFIVVFILNLVGSQPRVCNQYSAVLQNTPVYITNMHML